MPKKGFKHSDETKRKIKEKRFFQVITEEHKMKIGLAHKGKKLSKEHKEKLSKAKKGKKMSEETKLKMSKYQLENPIRYWKGKKRPPISKEWSINKSNSRKGEKSHFWKGGKTKLSCSISTSFQYRQWRSDIMQRDNYTCKECGRVGGILNVHHIKAFALILEDNKINNLEEAINCDELWNINNGMTLCKECHKKTDNYGRKYNKKSC